MRQKALLIVVSICIAALTLLALKSDTESSLQPAEEKPLVVVVPSYNNSDWVNKNLDSIFSQQYNNYRVIYIDDCSSDNTYELVKSYVDQHNLNDHITIIKNRSRKGPMANHFTAGHMCKDHEIIVDLDGDDWFKNNTVLQTINRVYSDPNVWMTYGQYEIYPGGKVGTCREFPSIVHQKNIYREYQEYDWISTHLRTFYAWLFKRIMLKDCIYKGWWIPVCCDRVMMFAMLEMAREHVKFIPDILYVYNCATTGNNFKKHLILQWHFNYVIGARPKYQKVKKSLLQNLDNHTDRRTTMVLFSEDNPMLAQATIESVQHYLHDLKFAVVYYASNGQFSHGYEKLRQKFKNINFYPYSRGKKSNLPSIVNQLLSQTDYVLFAHDGIIVKQPIDLTIAICALEKTHAHGFYFTLGKNITEHPNLNRLQKLPPFIEIENNISAWSFECGEYDWNKPQSLSLALYNAGKIRSALGQIAYDSPDLLEKLWSRVPFDMTQVGLVYNQSPAIIFDEAITPETSNALFEKGFKLDISAVEKIANKSISINEEIPIIS